MTSGKESADSIAEMLRHSGHSLALPLFPPASLPVYLASEQPNLLLVDCREDMSAYASAALTLQQAVAVVLIGVPPLNAGRYKGRDEGSGTFLYGAITGPELLAAVRLAWHNHTARGRIREAGNVNGGLHVSEDGEAGIIPFSEILYIYSRHVYVVLVTAGRERILRGALSAIAERLPGGVFCRVHRRYVVNVQHVTALRPDLRETGPQLIPVSKTYRSAIADLLGRR